MQQNCTPLVHFSCICNFWCVVIVVDRFLFVSICSWYKKILQLHVCCVVLCSVFVLHVCFVWVCLCAYIKQRILHLIITKIFSYQKGECCPSRHVCVVIDLIVVCVCVVVANTCISQWLDNDHPLLLCSVGNSIILACSLLWILLFVCPCNQQA